MIVCNINWPSVFYAWRGPWRLVKGQWRRPYRLDGRLGWAKGPEVPR